MAFSLRASELEQEGYASIPLTMNGFQKLHFHFFQDVYPFAGQFRNVQLKKMDTLFCQFEYVNDYATNLFRQLDEEPPWDSLKKAAERLAYFKSELNMLHPFREGNGRTIRTFIYLYALEKGIIWQYEKMDKERYITAMIKAVTDTSILHEVFLETIDFSEV
ncbi:hypothetical protein GCM10028778_21190 [Barrientosiimonas marina]